MTFVKIVGGEIVFEVTKGSTISTVSFSPELPVKTVATELVEIGLVSEDELLCSSSIDFPEEYGLSDFEFSKWWGKVSDEMFAIEVEENISSGKSGEYYGEFLSTTDEVDLFDEML